MMMNKRISALRQKMLEYKLDAYLIPSSDPHQSEYVADYWQSRTWISGFTGSAGLAIVLKDQSVLWTDSRYFLQAETQLANNEMELKKQGVAHAPEHVTWLKETLAKGSRIGLDGKLFSVGQVRSLAKSFYEKKIDLVSEVDLIAEVWEDRPSMPATTIFEHDAKYTGLTRAEKLAQVRDEMNKTEANSYFISTLDDIAWAFNLRGSDVACNPVFYAYAVIEKEKAHLFVEQSKLSNELVQKLNADAIQIHKYEAIETFLQKNKNTILIDKNSTNNQVYNVIAKDKIEQGENICRALKAIKNKTEISHIRKAMLKDGVALTKLFRWLDEELDKREIPETEIAEKLAGFRRAQGDYYGESFEAIVGYKGNGAIVHYRAEPTTCANLKKEGILLLDSGGQYFDGTTDVTRTVALGTPTQEQKHNFTLVLKGHIALDNAKFPAGTTGPQLDTLARMYLWQEGLNYGHGTGHGVGFFLNVHEPPQGFATNPTTSRGRTAIQPGMFTSNEPGYYKAGEYGIRIENLVICKEWKEVNGTKFYQHESLTLFPIDLNLVEKEILTPIEINWLNTYHQEVFEKLSPLLNEEEQVWMQQMCRKI